MQKNGNKKFELDFNTVVVIESLRSDEVKTGKNLYEDIIKRRCDLKKINCYFFEAKDFKSFVASLGTIVLMCESDILYPFLHFEIHGNKQGLELMDGTVIPWETLQDFCREINVLTNNQLIVSLATCSGAYFSSNIDLNKPSPFWGFVGPESSITSDNLVDDFTNFFDTLLTTFNINFAIESLHSNFSKYVYYSAQELFEKYIEANIQVYSKEDKRDKLKFLLDNGSNLNKEEFKKNIDLRINSFDRIKFMSELKNKFLHGRIIS